MVTRTTTAIRTAKKDPLATRSLVARDGFVVEVPPWLKPVLVDELEADAEPLTDEGRPEASDPEPPLPWLGTLSLAVADAVDDVREPLAVTAPAVIFVPVPSKEDSTVGSLVISTVLLVASADV